MEVMEKQDVRKKYIAKTILQSVILSLLVLLLILYAFPFAFQGFRGPYGRPSESFTFYEHIANNLAFISLFIAIALLLVCNILFFINKIPKKAHYVAMAVNVVSAFALLTLFLISITKIVVFTLMPYPQFFSLGYIITIMKFLVLAVSIAHTVIALKNRNKIQGE